MVCVFCDFVCACACARARVYVQPLKGNCKTVQFPKFGLEI